MQTLENRIKMKDITIGILDFGRRRPEINGLSRVEDVLNHAIKAEELGYTHFWLGEHHTEETGLPWCNPEVLLPVLAGMTENIRIGMAGILLLIHSPYSVACNFKLMANMFPNRVDLGLARGVPTNNIEIVESLIGRKFEMKELQATFNPRITELMHYLQLEDELKEKNIIIPPHKGDIPEVWYLGSAFNHSLNNSLEHGLHFCRSLFHGNLDVPTDFQQGKLAEFRENFEMKYGRKPRVNIAFAGVCHETEEKAWNALDKRYPPKSDGVNIVGTAEKFAEEIYRYNKLFDINEFTFFSLADDPDDIVAGDSLLAEMLKLKKEPAEAALV